MPINVPVVDSILDVPESKIEPEVFPKVKVKRVEHDIRIAIILEVHLTVVLWGDFFTV